MSACHPYTIAVLCYLFDAEGRVLLIHRRKPPNQHLYSPIGGKLDQSIGESPSACAVREIQEETGVQARQPDLHLTGIVSEQSYLDSGHWLMFLYELTHPAVIQWESFDEGRLEWHEPTAIENLVIPETDRQVIWPLFWRYRRRFFAVHIDCSNNQLKWNLHTPFTTD